MTEEKPTKERFQELLTLFDVDHRYAGVTDRKRRMLEGVSQLSEADLVTLLSLVARGDDKPVETARQVIRAVIDLRMAQASIDQSRTLVDATDSFREAVTELGSASQLLTKRLAVDEQRERRLDRRALFGASIIGGLIGAVAVLIANAVGWIQ